MLVRSQDRDDLVIIDNLSNINVHMGDIVAYDCGMHRWLGHYRSHKTAQKVVDMIEDAYKEDNIIVPFYRSYEEIAGDNPYYTSNRVVFHMPQDSEVKDD